MEEKTKKVGRKPTGRLRNKTFSIRVSEEERTIIQNYFNNLQKKYKVSSQTEAILKLIENEKNTILKR